MIKQGYLYVASGEKYVREAIFSVNSLKKVSRQAHATLITDTELNAPEFDTVVPLHLDFDNGNRKNNFLFKVEGLRRSPYEKTFFVDTDTFFCDGCEELFELLEYFDLLICQSPIGTRSAIRNGNTIPGLYSYNSGVIVYNDSTVTVEFLEKWLEIFKDKSEEYIYDQPPMMDALLHVNIKTYVLQSIYNFRIPFIVCTTNDKVKIIHGRDKNVERIANILNSDLSNRAWLPHQNRIINKNHNSFLRLIYSKLPKWLKKMYSNYAQKGL